MNMVKPFMCETSMYNLSNLIDTHNLLPLLLISFEVSGIISIVISEHKCITESIHTKKQINPLTIIFIYLETVLLNQFQVTIHSRIQIPNE